MNTYFTCKFTNDSSDKLLCTSSRLLSIPFISAKSDKSVHNLLEVGSRLLLLPFYKLECAILSFTVTIHQDKHIAREEKVCSTYPLVVVHFDSFERKEQVASITPDFHWELSCSLLQMWLILPCVQLEFRRLDMICGCLESRRLDSSYE